MKFVKIIKYRKLNKNIKNLFKEHFLNKKYNNLLIDLKTKKLTLKILKIY